MDPRIMPEKDFFQNIKRRQSYSLRKVLDILAQINFIPARILTKYNQQIAQVHGYLHTKIHLRASPNKF